MKDSIVLGIDVGVRNLSLCAINKQDWVRYRNNETDLNIIYWKVLNIINDT